jgi:hypothetical protein
MNSLLFDNRLLLVNSIVFWLTPIALAINLIIVQNKSNNYQKKIGYLYGSIWAIAFAFYLLIFITENPG